MRISRHDVMDAEARERFRAAIKEHSLRAAPSGDEVSQGCGCRRPERTDTYLAALAVEANNAFQAKNLSIISSTTLKLRRACL